MVSTGTGLDTVPVLNRKKVLYVNYYLQDAHHQPGGYVPIIVPKKFMDLKRKIEDILESGNFGEDIKILSDFIEAPAMFLNYYMRRYNITDYSVFDVKYEPKFKTQACDKTTFDFEIDINNNYKIELSIYKIDKPSDDEDHTDLYKFSFKFMDEILTAETETLDNIHYFIGQNIAHLLDKKLKS